ncbi:hypothetical protein OH76DRAFT_1361389, partial [Lentinus brumalis]
APGFSEESVFTSPNADWVPEFAVAHGEITTYSDGRWGHHEYSRWPQEFDRDEFHIACIPRFPLPNAPLSKVLWVTIQKTDWKVLNCGVLGVGLLHSDLEDMLVDAGQEAIGRLHELGDTGRWRKQGQFLIVCLNHTLDTLRTLPAVQGVIITLAAHVQRLTLEIWGLIKWLEDVKPVVEEARNVAARPWDILGAHTSSAHTAKRLHWAGIPVWFQQPLTTLLAVHEVVQPTPLPADFSRQPAYPRLLLAKRDMSGALNMPGEWLRAMSALVRRQTQQSALPELVEAEQDAPPEAKRWREGAMFVGEASSSLGPAPPVFFVQERDTSRDLGHRLPTQPPKPSQASSAVPSQPSRRARARMKKREADRLACTSHPPPPIPARQYYSSRLVTASPVWVQALTSQGHLPQPRSSVTYYFAPPWLLDKLEGYPVDTKNARYLHHWLSIRTFCRMRLFDRTINGRPLTISEWRDALWGDYKITEPVETAAAARVPREKLRHSLRASIRRLFGNANALPSYDGASRPSFGNDSITFDIVESDIDTQRRIVWEAYETNWRSELLALDASVVGSDQWPQVERWDREYLVSKVWGSGTSGLDIVPCERQAAPSFCWREPQEPGWEESRPYLAAFVTVLARWRDAPHGLTEAALAVLTCQPEEYARILSTAVNFYVRTFMDRYGRLPVPPVSASYV